MLQVVVAVIVSLAGAGEGVDDAPAPPSDPTTTSSTTTSPTTPPTPPSSTTGAPTPLLPALPWLPLDEGPVLPHPAFVARVKDALRAEGDREGYEARTEWCLADELATDVGDRSPLAVFARERCVAWTAAVGDFDEQIALRYLPAVRAHLESDVSEDEKIAVLRHFASMLSRTDTAGAWARGNVSRLRRGGALKLELNAKDPDGDEVADDECPYEAEDVDGDTDDDGCPEEEGTCCAIERDLTPWWVKATKVPATPDLALGASGAWSLGGVVDGDEARASVLAPAVTLALPFVEASLLLPTVFGVGLAGGARAGIGGALSLTPVELDPIFLDPDDFSWLAPTIGGDVFAGDDDVRFGLTVGNSITVARTVVVRPFYRYDLFAPAGTSPHGLGVVVRVNVFHALGEFD